MVGCLFMRTNWVVRETALRHMSREVVMQLRSEDGSRIARMIEITCQILAMTIADPVYKVYVASLVSACSIYRILTFESSILLTD